MIYAILYRYLQQISTRFNQYSFLCDNTSQNLMNMFSVNILFSAVGDFEFLQQFIYMYFTFCMNSQHKDYNISTVINNNIHLWLRHVSFP